MRRPTASTLTLTFALALAAVGCSRGADAAEKRRIFSREDEPAEAIRPQPTSQPPEKLLAMPAEEMASRLGSFEWTAAVDWTVTRKGGDARRVHASEKHHVRQLASGEFEADAQVDGGRGPGGLAGRHVVWAGGMTYARGEFAPWRERPTDRGRDARRFRDESLGLATELFRLVGPALVLEPTGDGAHIGRRAEGFSISFDPSKVAPAAPSRPASAGAPDDDTARRLAFLDGHEPSALSGEVLLDAETGAPLLVRLTITFALRGDPQTRVELSLAQQVRAVGGSVGSVKPPADPLPDARKPPGVAAALEAAGLKTRAQAAEEKAEPEDEEH
jgi:hypothetical protein